MFVNSHNCHYSHDSLIVMIVTIVMLVMIVMIVKIVDMIVKIVKNGVDCCGVVTCRMLPAVHPGSSEGYYIFLRYIVVGFMEGYDISLRPFRGLDRLREIIYF